ncbi:MAG TPA: C39 family peptidase [Gaiellaceae bacterium]|nr:C39 family peptidase [Gaiellaceae bacterium]
MPRTLVVLLLLLLAAVSALSASAKSGGAPYATDHDSWRASDGDFATWSRSGVSLGADGKLRIDLATAASETDPYPAGGYQGRNYYNGGTYLVGEAVSPDIAADPFTEAIPSWNAETPDGSWVETQLSARIAGRWTKYYTAGPWASGTGTVERHSVNLQADTDSTFAVDTLILNGKKAPPADAYRVKLRLFSTNGAIPAVRFASVALSGAAPVRATLQPGDAANWNTLVDLPEYSQMVYPDGGNVWCSPTSVSMVLAGWQGYMGPAEPRVRQTVVGVFDWRYDGHGNWPFNTAWAAHEGMEAQVTRFTSFRDVERWVKAGVPVVFSFAWSKGDLTGAAIPSSDGHIAVIVGFDGAGNPIVNDPAAAADADVRRTYDRTELETLWLQASGGTVYLIYPPGHPTPPIG